MCIRMYLRNRLLPYVRFPGGIYRFSEMNLSGFASEGT